VWKRQTIGNLAERHGLGARTVRRILDQAPVKAQWKEESRAVVCIFDATTIGSDILLAARAPALKRNLGASWILSETKEAYASLRQNIEAKGYTLTAVVLDGRTGIPRVFEDIPVQICQFHQLQVVRRKTTLRPETTAGWELLQLAFTIAKTNEETFARALTDWHARYGVFINERTYALGTKRWRYTHRKVRSAYLSLKRNLPHLFTYQRHPELDIPNTTNSLDGYWSRVKNLLGAHRGKNKERIRKMVAEILKKTDC